MEAITLMQSKYPIAHAKQDRTLFILNLAILRQAMQAIKSG